MDDCLAEQEASSPNRIKMHRVVVSGDHHESLLVFGPKNPLMGYHLAERNSDATMRGRESLMADLIVSCHSAIKSPLREILMPKRCSAYC